MNGINTPLTIADSAFNTNSSTVVSDPKDGVPGHILNNSDELKQDEVNANSSLKRLQQDLLVLTSLPDNSTLHFRPSWFPQQPHSKQMWTLHNPPNVVSERVAGVYDPKRKGLGVPPPVWTRRLRRDDDPPPAYIKTWKHWQWYCQM